MKSNNILFTFVFVLSTQFIFAQKQEFNHLTNEYYKMKNALIADDGQDARKHAEVFLTGLDSVSEKEMSASQLNKWKELLPALKTNAKQIASTVDITRQREHLNELSISLFALLKAFKVNEESVYYQYCPMKKAYWLSSEKEIKNPYYGNKMLTCGSVKESLK